MFSPNRIVNAVGRLLTALGHLGRPVTKLHNRKLVEAGPPGIGLHIASLGLLGALGCSSPVACIAMHFFFFFFFFLFFMVSLFFLLVLAAVEFSLHPNNRRAAV